MKIHKLRELRDRAEQALSAMLGQTTYICFGFELPKKLRPAHVFAYTRLALGCVVRPYLGCRDHGPGPAVVIDERFLTQFARSWARGRFARPRVLAAQLFLGVVVHEFGHVFQIGWVHELEPDLSISIVELAELSTEIQLAQPPALPTERPDPFVNHDAKFVRVMLHLHHRLRTALGIRFEPFFEADTYGMAPLYRYRSAIGDEPEALADVPLQAIADIPPPEPFIEQWQSDVQKWWLALPHPTEASTAMLLAWRNLFTP